MEEFDKTSLELRKAMQQVEDLKEQIAHKHGSERWVETCSIYRVTRQVGDYIFLTLIL